MKKYIKLLILLLLIITLTSCKDTCHRKVFNKLYDENYELAKENRISMMGSTKYSEYTFLTYELSEIKDDEAFSFPVSQQELTNKGIDRVILSCLIIDGKKYWDTEIIEFKTIEDAEKMLEKDEMYNKDYARYENIVYALNYFGATFVNGLPISYRGMYLNKNKDFLFFSDENISLEILTIPNSVKYIGTHALQKTAYIKLIVCGDNLEKIGGYAIRLMENLDYFKANANLKSLGNGALSNNPKLKTVILNEGLEYIGEKAFAECPNLEYVVIPSSVKDIGYRAFTHGVLYIEAESKPAKWDRGFAGPSTTIYWVNEWEYNEDGIPEPINK